MRSKILKKKLNQEKISITQNNLEEKTAAFDEDNTDQNWEVSQENLAEDNFSSDEVEESVVSNFSVEDDLKKNKQKFISEDIMESSESAKFKESVQAAGQLFEEELAEVAANNQHTKIADQIDLDDADEILEENELLEDILTSPEAEYREQETEYVEVDVDPIKLEVDMDEIVSAEELTETAGFEQHT